MRPYSFKLAASTDDAFNIVAQGSYVRYRKCLTGISDPEILIETNTGDLIPLLPGEDANIGVTAELFKVKSMNGTVALQGVLMIAGGNDGVKTSSDRISGEVSVIDGGRSVTDAGQSFLGFGSKANLAANISYVQLLNPSGSGKNVWVKVASGVKGTAASTMELKWYDTPLTTLVGNATNKKLGGADSTAQIRTEQSTSSLGTRLRVFGSGLSYGNQDITFEKPIKVEAGRGLLMCAEINVDVYCSFDFDEAATT